MAGQLMTIRLSRVDAQPWGFRLQGGKDFATPLVVQKVNGGSLAEQAGLLAGDALIKVNNSDAFNMRHKDAQDLIVRSGNNFEILIQRGGSVWRPQITPTGSIPSPASHLVNSVPTVTQTSLAYKPQEVRHIGSGYNNAARPFSSVNGNDGQVKSIVNKQYNTPVGIYSEEAIAETLSAQAEVLAGGVLGVNFKKNEKIYNAANSEVLKMLHEQENDNEPVEEHHAPANFFWTASHAVGGAAGVKSHRPGEEHHQPQAPSAQPKSHEDERIGTPLKQNTLAPTAPHRPSLPGQTQLPPIAPSYPSQQTYYPQATAPAPQLAPKPFAPTFGAPPKSDVAKQGGGIGCDNCGASITGVFVRIKDKNLHAECFKCATCGTNLKNQGYFNFNNKLYCDIHARLAAMNNPPKGTDGYVPVPMKPATKLSANTISAALDTYAQHNGSSNLNTGYGGPKPFNSSPMSPPMRGPQSPSIYPPPTTAQTWDTPTKPQSKPQVNPYATLPRTAGHSHEEDQRQCYMYEQQACEQKQFQEERSIFEEDVEVMEANRQQAGHFKWPPPSDDNRNTPTATPLYIPPPETQHVVPKPLTEKPPEQQWQSRSAPELTTNQQKAVEIESSSDSYTSTSTTTTTTSEEYHRMYQAQVQAYQMQQAYEQYGSEMDYHMDMEVAAMQQNQSFASVDFYSAHSGRRSAQECAEYITGPLSTQHLVDLVRAVTPKPETPPPKAPRKVEFCDEVQMQQEKVAMAKKLSEEAMEMRKTDRKQSKQESNQEQVQKIIKEERSEEFRPAPPVVTPESRKFTATPEIKIEIPEVKPIPPSNIPNPVPKEWISPMVKALTTAPDKPIEMAETSLSEANKIFESIHFHEEKAIKIHEEPATNAEKPPVEPEILKEEPPKGSFISRTMTTAPSNPLKFLDNYNDPIPLPEETEPYMPPPIDMKPYYREDYRPKSPFLSALTIAPDRPYTPYGHDVCSQLLDLPTPKEKLTMVDALTVASSRGYTPLNMPTTTTASCGQKSSTKTNSYEFFNESENASNQCCQSNETCASRQTSAFTSVKGDSTLSPFQPRRESLNSNATNDAQTCQQNSVASQSQTILAEKRDSFQSDQRITSMQQKSTFQSVSSTTTATSATSYFHSMNQQSACSQSSAICEKERQQCQQSNAIEQRQQQIQQQQQQQQQQQKSQSSDQKISFPPAPGPMAKKTLHSGLHKPDNIPKYQRNWTVLPTQSPVRTPEPPELKENVPLAFIDTHIPRELTPSVEPSIQSKSVAVNSSSSSTTKQHATATFTETKASETQQRSQEYQQRTEEKKYKTALPIIVTENNAPVTMAFQSLDDVDHSHAHPRPYTPSLINKPAPVIPYYQTPDKLVSEECPATRARLYDPRSPSPLPDRARSPAPGPPPNPLSNIRAPRIKEPAPAESVSNYWPSSQSELTPTYRPPIQTGSITTGQSYYGTQNAQFQTQEQGHVVSHYQTGYHAGSQKYTDKPEVCQKTQIGDTTIQTRSKESQFNEENRSALETKSTAQVGNMQIERRKKVVEEFEHTQTAKSIEIRKTQGGEVKQITQSQQSQPTGRTGFVANQARRLSNLEQEISSLSSQSKAISARAANLAPSPIFPRYTSPEPVSTFPLKSPLPPYDEPTRPTYVVSANATNQMVGESASKKAYEAAKMAPNTPFTPSSQQQHRSGAPSQSISTGATKTITNASSSISSSAATSQAAFSSDSSKLINTTSSAIPVPAFKAPTPYTQSSGLSAGQLLTNTAQQVAPPRQPPSQPITNNVAYKPPTSANGMPAPPPPTSSNIVPNVVNDPSPASAGPTSKGGVFGATSTPKRGRGILNKAAGPGVRVPICGCCNTHIRGPFITALGRIWCPEHFVCVNGNCRRPLQDIGFVEEKGDLYCEFCFEKYLAPSCSKCNAKIKGDCLNAIGKHYHPECFTCSYCGKLFGNSPFFLEEGEPYCEADWNELFTTKCFACGFPVEAGDRWVEALNHNYHSQCFNCTMCKKNLEGQSFYNKGGRPFCKNHAR